MQEGKPNSSFAAKKDLEKRHTYRVPSDGAVETLLVDLDAVVLGFVNEFDGSVTYAAGDTRGAW